MAIDEAISNAVVSLVGAALCGFVVVAYRRARLFRKNAWTLICAFAITWLLTLATLGIHTWGIQDAHHALLAAGGSFPDGYQVPFLIPSHRDLLFWGVPLYGLAVALAAYIGGHDP